jgi:hypothetical protein
MPSPRRQQVIAKLHELCSKAPAGIKPERGIEYLVSGLLCRASSSPADAITPGDINKVVLKDIMAK